MQEVGRAVAQQEKGLPEVTAEAKLIFDDHAHYTQQKCVWPARLMISYTMLIAVASAALNLGQCDVCQCRNFLRTANCYYGLAVASPYVGMA